MLPLRDCIAIKEALASAEQAIKLDPQLAGAWNNKGAALEEDGIIPRGTECIQESCRIGFNTNQCLAQFGMVI